MHSLPIYLNNAATSFPKAPGLAAEVAAFINKIPEHPGRSESRVEDILFHCRKALADLLSADDSSGIVLCKNSTEALNMVFHGIELKGGIVLTTAMEHNSVLRPLYLLQKKKKIKLEIVPCDSEGRVNEKEWFERIDKLSPRLVVLNHASNVTGAINNAENLLNYAKQKGSLTILDASQSLGLLDINVGRIGADVVAFTGHKYLLGPSGTGGMYIRKGLEIEPLFVGGTGIKSDLKEMPPEMPGKLEPGTPAIPLFAGLLHCLKWQKDNPVQLKKMENLTQRLQQGLIERGADVIKVNGGRTFILSFQIPGLDLKEVGYILGRSIGIICRTGLHCAPLIHNYLGTSSEGSVRFSISRFTTLEDIDHTLNGIEKLVNKVH